MAAFIGAFLVWLGLHVTAAIAGTGTAIMGIPFFWIAAFLLVLTLVVRHHKAIKAGFMKFFSWFARGIKSFFVDPIKKALDWLTRLIDKLPGSGLLKGGFKALTGRASGGPVEGGKTYLVGERGPELFSSRSSGYITPNDKLGGGVTNNINLSIDVGGVTDRTDKRALAREISDMLNQEMRRLGGSPTRGRY